MSSITLRKEIASFRAAWNWGVQAELVTKSFPNKGLKFPKLDEKAPFQTWAEIERRISLGGLVNGHVAELWDALYLQKAEIDELLAYLKGHSSAPWLYALVCTAAHTAAGQRNRPHRDCGRGFRPEHDLDPREEAVAREADHPPRDDYSLPEAGARRLAENPSRRATPSASPCGFSAARSGAPQPGI